jgi:hypothetical protein
MSGCPTCGGFGYRHDAYAHDDWGTENWLSPWPDHLVPIIRTHDWLGLDDDDRCGNCMIRLDMCTEPCPGGGVA